MLIDTHAHLFAGQFSEDQDAAVERAQNAGVEMVILPNIDNESIDPMWRLHQKYPDYCLPTMGLHPCSVKEDYQKVLNGMEKQLSDSRLVAIGETGIDLHWDTSTLDHQLSAFRQHISWAKSTQLPIIIHSRDALEETIREIEAAQDGSLTGVFHCFTGTGEEVQQIRDVGFTMGLGGVLTFKNGGLDKILKKVGLDNMVLETDAPYLAPAPHRGKRNEPAYVKIIAEKAAEVLGISVEEVIRKTGENALKVFRK
nr:TatD family hydrolase [Saprospiraceae bacterium]